MMFGIGTAKARLHVDAFVNMLGEDEQSWGLSHKGLVWHKGQHRYTLYHQSKYQHNINQIIFFFVNRFSTDTSFIQCHIRFKLEVKVLLTP